MSYKTILVHLDTSRRATQRLDLALKLAASHEAHLIALYAPFQPDAKSLYAMSMIQGFWEEKDQLRRTQRAVLEQQFREGLARDGIAGEWRSTNDYPNRVAPLHARHADLVIAGQFDVEDPDSFVAEKFCENLVLSSGRPTLYVPYTGSFPSVGSRVMIGWDGSREATRAIHDALPVLRRAAHVSIVTINALQNQDADTRIPGADIATVIARHGIKVELVEIEGVAGLRLGELLLSQASDLSADLIVTGAFAHARWQELVLGGVTRTLFNSMTVPVLMSH